MTPEQKNVLAQRVAIEPEARATMLEAQKQDGIIAMREYKLKQLHILENMRRLRDMRLHTQVSGSGAK